MKIQTINLDNGDVYEGQVSSKGQFHGRGRYYFKKSFLTHSLQYEGEFVDGKQHGKGQLIKYNNQGSFISHKNKQNVDKFLIYDGQWRNGMKHGEGKYFYDSNQHYYEGSWLNNQRNGNKGKYVSPLGIYEGKWKNGMANGDGTLTLKNNTVFRGVFVDNQFVRGVVTYPNGDGYHGEIKNGLRNDPQGRYIYRTKGREEIKYVGGWKDDKKDDQEGKGCVIYEESGTCFKGTFKDGSFVQSLRSTWQWPDGSQLNGWFSRSKNPNSEKQYSFSGVLKEANGAEKEVREN